MEAEAATRHLARALEALMSEERRFGQLCRRLSERPGADTSPLRDADDALQDVRAQAARALVAALATGQPHLLCLTPEGVEVEQVALHDIAEVDDPAAAPEPALVPRQVAASAPSTDGSPSTTPTAPPPRPPAPATLLALQSRFQTAAVDPLAHHAPPRSPAANPLRWLPRPAPIHTSEDLGVWVGRFERAVEGRTHWAELPAPRQALVLAVVVTLGRLLQQESSNLQCRTSASAVSGRFPALTAYSAAEQPGFVYGLARSHQPRQDSWLWECQQAYDTLMEDAPSDHEEERRRDLLDTVLSAVSDGLPDRALADFTASALAAGVPSDDTRLLAALAPRIECLNGRLEPGIPTLKNHLKAFLEVDADIDAEDEANPLPAQWRGLAHTRAKRVVAVGGDERRGVTDRWRQAFGFEEVIWDTGWSKRRSKAQADRIRAGSVDLVFIIRRFVNHSATDIILPACKDSGVPYVLVSAGYGVNQLRLAMEHSLLDAPTR